MPALDPFVGRGDLIEAARQVVDFDAGSPGEVLALHGPRGTGRSALVRQLAERVRGAQVLVLPFGALRTTPGRLAATLFRQAIERLTEVRLDPEAPPARWLDHLPCQARAALGEACGDLRPGAHPVRGLRSLVRGVEALARVLERRLVVVLDHPDALRGQEGFPGLSRKGVPLRKLFVPSAWVRWVFCLRYPASLAELERTEKVRRLAVPRLRRAESYHLAALFLEAELRPIPRKLLWPLHGLSDGRPGYLRAMVLRLLREARGGRGVPGQDEVRAAFLREVLGADGQVAMACEAALARDAAAGVDRAAVDLLARRGALGPESVAQLLSVGVASASSRLERLTGDGLLRAEGGRYRVEDRVLAFRLRHLPEVQGGDPAADPALVQAVADFEQGELCDLHGAGEWERRIRTFLRWADGRELPGDALGASRRVLAPSGGIEEAAVGWDEAGRVDGYPALQAADLLLNGRDRRWLVELPRPGRPVDVEMVERSVRLRRFFQRTYHRPIERLWLASEDGFTPEAWQAARAEGVLVSDGQALSSLEAQVLDKAA